jgi:hypothetical protein
MEQNWNIENKSTACNFQPFNCIVSTQTWFKIYPTMAFFLSTQTCFKIYPTKAFFFNCNSKKWKILYSCVKGINHIIPHQF